MDIGDFISKLRRRDVRLWLDGAELQIDAPKGVLAAQEVRQLREHKAGIIKFLQRFKSDSRVPPLEPGPRGGQAPLSYAQQRLWIADQLPGDGASAVYHIRYAIGLRGQLDRKALGAAFDTLVMRHEALRTTIKEAAGAAVQVIAPAGSFSLQVIDLSDAEPDQRQVLLREQIAEEARAPFDLGLGPLIRGRLLCMSDSEHVMLMSMHHIIADGWSMAILMREISVLYAAYREARPNPLAPLRLQYADYAQWQREWLQGEKLNEQLAYWTKQLAAAPAVELPLDRPRPQVPSFAGAMHAFEFPQEVSDGLRRLAQSTSTTLFMVTLAVFEVLLSRLSGQDDLVVASPVAGRHHRGTEELVGFFISTVLLRLKVRGDMSFRELLSKVKEVVLGAYAYQDMPFEMLAAELRRTDAISAAEYRRVSFAFQNEPAQGPELPGLVFEPVEQPHFTAKTDFLLIVREYAGSLHGAIEYSTALFDARSIDVIAQRLVQAAQQVAADPRLRLEQFDLALPGAAATGLAEYRYASQYQLDRTFWLENSLADAAVSLSVRAVAAPEKSAPCSSIELPAAVVQALKQRCAAAAISRESLLVTAIALYLHRAADIEQGCIGVLTDAHPHDSRSQQAMEEADTAAVLPLRFSFDAQQTWASCLQHSAGLLSSAARHARFAMADIRRLHGLRENDAPLFKTVIEVRPSQQQPECHPATAQLNAEARELVLSIFMDLARESIRVQLRGDAQCYEAWELQIHLGNLLQFINILCDPACIDSPVTALPLLGGADSQRIPEWSAGRRADFPCDALIHELFEAQALSTPDDTAVIFEDSELSFGQLNHHADRLAHRLRGLGAGPDQRVGICLERGPDMLVAVLAVLKAGAAYVPLDPQYPAERLGWMIEDSAAQLLVTESSLLGTLPPVRVQLIVLDDPGSADGPDSAIDPEPCTKLPAAHVELKPTHLAYVIYTSGSTGQPKGVMVEHRSVLNLWRSLELSVYQNHPQCRRVSLMASLSFDASVRQWVQLLSGRAVVIIPQSVRVDGRLLIDYMRRHAIDGLDSTPSQLNGLLAAGLLQGEGRFPQLLLVGGEAIAPMQWRMLSRAQQMTFYNGYGPTECTVDASVARAADLADCPNIGRPLANMRVYILDRHLQPVPVAAAGEIYIGGYGVARGYLNRPALTTERFLRDPFSTDAAARMYKSGDLARWLPDGSIEYLGRNDGQVKIRGCRIELGEIEAQLRVHPGIRDAAIVAQAGESQDRRLVAYFTSDLDLPAPALFNWMAERLPQHMLPAAYMRLRTLPLTPNGKLDRKALPVPGCTTPHQQSDPSLQAPRGDLENLLADIWREVLHVATLGRHDNFFTAGGSSLSAIQAVGAAGRVGLRLKLKQIFEHQSIAALAAVIAADDSAGLRAAGASAALRAARQSADAADVAGDVPFTPVQLNAIGRGSDAFLKLATATVLKCRRPIEIRLLDEALQQLMSYHDMLRLRVVKSGEQWIQTIVPASQVAGEFVPSELLSCGSLAELGDEVGAVMGRLAEAIDLSQPPILKAALMQCEPGAQQVLVVASHHFATDPISWNLLLEDLEVIYEALAAQQPVRLPAKGASYQQWAQALSAYANSAAAAGDIDYWQSIAWNECARLPVDLDATSVEASSSASILLASRQTDVLLADTSRLYGVQLNEILLATLATALANWSGQHSFCINLYHHGRVSSFSSLNVARTVGWFSTPVPMLLEVKPGAHVATTLRSVEQRLHALPNEGIGHSVLRHLRKQWHEPALPPLEVLLNHQGVLGSLAGQRLFEAQFDSEQYVKALKLVELPWKIAVLSNIVHGRLNVHFVSRSYREQTLQCIADEFQAALRELLRSSAPVAAALAD